MFKEHVEVCQTRVRFSFNSLDHNPFQNLMNFGGDEKINRKFLNLLSKVEVMSSLKTLAFITSFKIGKGLLSRLVFVVVVVV